MLAPPCRIRYCAVLLTLFRLYRLQKKRGVDSNDEDDKGRPTADKGKVKAGVGGACFG